MKLFLSNSTLSALSKAQFICPGDVGVHIPENILITPQMHGEIEDLLRMLQLPVREAAHCVLASLLEQQGIKFPDSPSHPTQ